MHGGSLMKVGIGTVTFFVLNVTVGCVIRGSDPDEAAVKIVGGTQISLSKDPWTLKIAFPNDPSNFCTATFVSHNTMLTAAHCTDEHPIITLPELGGVQSIKVYQFPLDNVSGIIDANDVAVVVFPDNTAPAHARFATESPKKGDKVVLVGYGSCTEFLGPAASRKRCRGTNEIAKIDVDSRIVTHESTGVYVSKGDSGGPLFTVGNEIVGIANSAESDGSIRSMHTNLFAAKNLAWLRQVVQEGTAVICGLDGRACDNQEPDSASSSDAPALVTKAETMAKQLVAKLLSESTDCSFALDGPVTLTENDTRFTARVAYGATSSLGEQIKIDVSLTEHVNGAAIFSKLKSRGQLAAAFPGCTF